MVALSRQHLFLSACASRCRTLLSGRHQRAAVCTLCSVQGRLQVVLLCLRYEDTAVAIGAWFVSSLRGVYRRGGSKTNKQKKKRKTKSVHGSTPKKTFRRRQLLAESNLRGQRTAEGGRRRHLHISKWVYDTKSILSYTLLTWNKCRPYFLAVTASTAYISGQDLSLPFSAPCDLKPRSCAQSPSPPSK